jgi:magnesium chelatase accessory protein
MTSRYPDWAREGADWPNAEASSFVTAGGYRWHVQQLGEGPVCLLIHGTGAATHSWRDVMPKLATEFRVIALDLPGHGFTRPNFGQKPNLPSLSRAIGALLDTLAVQPELIVGHSAGVALAAQVMMDRQLSVPLVGFAPALMPFPGLAARLFPQLAKMLFTNPLVSIIVSRLLAPRGETAKFLARATGSRIDAATTDYYARLFGKSGHCDGAIRMMANWRLEPLRDRLGELTSPVLLLHPDRDTAIPLSAVNAAAALIPGCTVRRLPALGHLAHEEDPALAATLIMEWGAAVKALGAAAKAKG